MIDRHPEVETWAWVVSAIYVYLIPWWYLRRSEYGIRESGGGSKGREGEPKKIKKKQKILTSVNTTLTKIINLRGTN